MKNRVVILVSNGVVDWVTDSTNVNVMLIDTDNLDQGDTLDKDDIEDFNDMIPDWIKEQYIEG